MGTKMNQWKVRAVLCGFAFAALVLATGCPLPGSSSSGNNNNGGGSGNSAQTWVLDFGPDPVKQGREEEATVVVSPFTYSGAFDEVSPDPLGGLIVYNGNGSCSYQLKIGGMVSHAGQYDSWSITELTGAGCGMQSMGNGSGNANGAFPNATSVSGTASLTTQSPLGTTTDSQNWTGSIQSGGSNSVTREGQTLEHQSLEPSRIFQPLN